MCQGFNNFSGFFLRHLVFDKLVNSSIRLNPFMPGGLLAKSRHNFEITRESSITSQNIYGRVIGLILINISPSNISHNMPLPKGIYQVNFLPVQKSFLGNCLPNCLSKRQAGRVLARSLPPLLKGISWHIRVIPFQC